MNDPQSATMLGHVLDAKRQVCVNCSNPAWQIEETQQPCPGAPTEGRRSITEQEETK